MFLPSQKNLLYKAIQEQGLKSRDFTLAETPPAGSEVEGLKLVHKPTGFYFRLAVQHSEVDQNRKVVPGLYLYCAPKREGVVLIEGEQNTHAAVKDWPTTVAVLSKWLVWLKQEVEEPDLWNSLESTLDPFDEDAPITDERFTPAEIKLLQARIDEVEQRVFALNLPEEAKAAINEVIREVPDKAKRLTKKELSDVVFSTVVKECFKWGLTAEHLQSIWQGCKYLFTVANTMLT